MTCNTLNVVNDTWGWGGGGGGELRTLGELVEIHTWEFSKCGAKMTVPSRHSYQ